MAWNDSEPAMPCWMLLMTASSAAACCCQRDRSAGVTQPPVTTSLRTLAAAAKATIPDTVTLEMRAGRTLSETLDHLAEAGRVSEALADALGRAVAAAHRVAPTVTDLHFVETLAGIIAQNEAELAAEPHLLSLQDLRALAAATRDAFERVKPLLQFRERAGLVRRCHGDLHLGNIVLIDDVLYTGRTIRAALDWAAEHGGAFAVLWHPDRFDPATSGGWPRCPACMPF